MKRFKIFYNCYDKQGWYSACEMCIVDGYDEDDARDCFERTAKRAYREYEIESIEKMF